MKTTSFMVRIINNQKLCNEIEDSSMEYLERHQKLNGGEATAELWIFQKATDKSQTEKPRASVR